MCTRSTDAAYIERWGTDTFEERYGKYGLTSIWDWGPDSGIKPCRLYLRHCVLAVRKQVRAVLIHNFPSHRHCPPLG
jgi:hypothetical protein